MAKKKYNFMSTPIGAGKRYIVTMDGSPFAGFDKKSQAKIYIAMQKAKVTGSRAPAFAAGKNWDIQDTR